MRNARLLAEALEPRLLFDRVHGVDVSQFQGTMNWDAAWAQNVRFAWVRASRSGLGEDTLLDTNLPPAKARGILTGVYHHASPILNGAFTDPILDAELFVQSAFAYMLPGYLRPVLDLEEDGSLDQNGYTINTWGAAFIDRVQQLSGVRPIIYTTGFQAEFFLNEVSVAASPDVWVAIHVSSSDPITTSSQPTFNGQIAPRPWREAAAVPEQAWDFWQYSGSENNGKGPLYGASGNSSIDLNVFNGDNINLLKQQFVIGAADIPQLVSPADGAIDQPFQGLILDWEDSADADAYDVYLDNMSTPAATNLTQSQWTAPMLAGGAHTWRVVAKGVVLDDDTHVTSEMQTFTALPPPLPGVPGGPVQHNITVNSHPVVLDWADTPTTVSYDIYLGTSQTPAFTNLTTSQSPPINPSDGTRLWRVVAKNPSGSTDGPQWSYTMDRTAPTATYSGNGMGGLSPLAGQSAYQFFVTYADATSQMDTSSFEDDDILVTGPNGFSQQARFVGIVPSGLAPKTVGYEIDAPTDTWSRYDNGTYTLTQLADSVRDTAGNARAAGTIATFNFNVPFAQKLGAELVVEFGPQATPIRVEQVGAQVHATEGATTLSFSDITLISVNGSPGDDLLEWAGPIDGYTSFNGGDGNDELAIRSGLMLLADDLSLTTPNLAITVDAGAAANFYTPQRLRRLTVNGTVTLGEDGDYTIVTRGLNIGPAGRLDLFDKDLVVDPAAGDPPVTAADIAALVAAGRNGGAWDGFGLVTGAAAALSGLTSLAVAPASAVVDFVGGVGTFNGLAVSPAAVLVKYTYAGDANFDGIISGDDYSAIDFASGTPGAGGWFNGDFNYDGIISGDDYSIIDFNLVAQGAPL